MYISRVTKKEKGSKKNSEYLVQYIDRESGEGLSEQFRRFYGLKEIRPGSYFYLGDFNHADDNDWSGFQRQSSSN